MKHYVKSCLYASGKNTTEYLVTTYDGDLSVDPPMPADDNGPSLGMG